MDLLFTIAGLLLVWSAASFFNRETAALARLIRKKPRKLYALRLPVRPDQVLSDLEHFARRNHLGFGLLQTTRGPALVLKSGDCRELLFVVYLRQHTEAECELEIGAAHLNSAPYVFFRKKHEEAALSISRHLKTSWQRRNHFDALIAGIPA